MHVALTGASGFIGSAIARQLQAAGHTVTALVRATSRREHLASCVDRFVVGDQAERTVWPALLEDASCVIHNALDWTPLKEGDLARHLDSNVTAAIELLHASAPRQFIFMSTIAVHHDMRPRWEGRIDEDHPMRPGTLYGAGKAAVESHLWAAHFGEERSTCAFRPCAVYGLDPRPARTIGHPMVERIRRERRYARAGGGKFVHVDDVAAATVAAVGNPAAAGRVYNLVDCYARWGDLAVMIAEILGVDAEIDLSSPSAPKNTFDVTAVRELVADRPHAFARGHDGLREHLRMLVAGMDAPRERSPRT